MALATKLHDKDVVELWRSYKPSLGTRPHSGARLGAYSVSWSEGALNIPDGD
jgi:hypothetical protein